MTITKHIFPNGFKLVHEKINHKNESSSINVFCDVGSIYEPENLRGASHFIEHMCFKGTKKVPKSKDIYLTYDKIGAYLNAYTEKRYTCYTVKCDSDFLESIISMLSDMLLNSTFDKKEFIKEEHVVIEENVKSEDLPSNIMFDILTEMIYKGSSFENVVDKLEYHKSKFVYEDIIEFYKLFYKPSRMVLSITSSCSFKDLRDYLKTTDFVKYNNSAQEIPSKYMIVPCVNHQETTRMKIIKLKGYKTIHLGISFRVETMDKYCINILQTILSGPMSSRLFSLLREDNGLTYTSSVYTNYHKIYGDITIYTETEKNKILKNGIKPGVLPLLINELKQLMIHGVTKKELETAKQYMKGSLKISIENIDNITSHNGEHYLIYPNDELIPYKNLYEMCYKNITIKNINDTIKKYFRKNLMSISIVGPDVISEKKLYEMIQSLD
jgi:predicted Zn-dependent peptidase